VEGNFRGVEKKGIRVDERRNRGPLIYGGKNPEGVPGGFGNDRGFGEQPFWA